MRNEISYGTANESLVLICLFKPLEEGLTRLPDLLARFFIDILLADMGSPLGNHFLVQNIILIERHEDLWNSRNQLGVSQSHQSLDTSQKSFLVLLAGDHLAGA